MSLLALICAVVLGGWLLYHTAGFILKHIDARAERRRSARYWRSR